MRKKEIGVERGREKKERQVQRKKEIKEDNLVFTHIF